MLDSIPKFCLELLAILTMVNNGENAAYHKYHNLIYSGDSVFLFDKNYRESARYYEKAFLLAEPLQHDLLSLSSIYLGGKDTFSFRNVISLCYLKPKNVLNSTFFASREFEPENIEFFKQEYKLNWNKSEWKRRKRLKSVKYFRRLYLADQFFRVIPFIFKLNRDKRNFNKLYEYVIRNGVPGIRNSMDTYFVRDGLSEFSYILNHAVGYPWFYERFKNMLPILIASVEKGELYPYTIGILIDKYLFYQTQYQLIGELNIIGNFDSNGYAVYSRSAPFCVSKMERDNIRYKLLMRPYSQLMQIRGLSDIAK